MPDNKVIRFPGTSSVSPEASSNGTWLAQQPGLFNHRGENRGRIVFLDIHWLAEEIFLNLMSRNGVTALFDLRPRPVFERPRFRHRHVVHYLYERDVQYLEYAMLTREARDDCGRFHRWPLDTEAQLSEILSRGLTVCLYDDGARSAGWIDDVRRLVRFTPGYLAEVHPRALLGVPEGAGRR